MISLVAFALGLLIGFSFGFVVFAVLSASRQDDELLNQTYKEETKAPQPSEKET